MESAADPASALSRWRETLGLIVVAILPWLVQPGLTQPDTKVDLTLSPLRYLARSLDAWNSHAGLGELQNQAYGYLFPMGPVHGVGLAAGLPPWAVQRLWWSVLLLTAYGGARLVIDRLGVAGGGVAMLAAVGYACGPRVLTLLADNSVEAWPYAVAPWTLLAALPLARAHLDRTAALHTAATCGLVTVALGGVNATASAVVLGLPFIYLVTHPVGRRRLGWWGIGILLGALWWLIPLVVLGRYAYPFLNYIETARITTAVTAPQHVLRGASDWVAYIVDADGHPVWQGGWVVAQSATSIVAGVLVAGLGVWGMLRTRGQLRRFLILSLLVGTVGMAIGHATPSALTSPPLAGMVRSLLDGSLAPLRNVHKLDPLVRLPIIVGLARLGADLVGAARLRVRALIAVLAVLVIAALTPIWQGRLGDAGAFRAIPSSWSRVAHLVDADASREGGSTLLMPAARTATYTWGTTTDEPLSALASSPIVNRPSAPLGDPSSTRVLDALDGLVAQGASQPVLADQLARMGIRRIVVRHDIAASVRATPWQRIEATLGSSPGLTRMATEGSLTVWRVDRAGASAYGRTVRVWGAAETTLALGTVGELDGTAVELTTPAAASIVTDSYRRRVYNNGAPVGSAFGPTTSAADIQPQRLGDRDLPSGGPASPQVTRVFSGFTRVTASSSGADPFASAYVGPSAAPWAAVDGSPTTTWRTGGHETRASLRLVPKAAVNGTILIQFPSLGTLPATVVVQAGNRNTSVDVGGRHHVSVPEVHASAGSPVVIELVAPAGTKDPVLGIADVSVPGAAPGTALDIPDSVDAGQQLLLSVEAEDDGSLARAFRTDAAVSTHGWPLQVWVRGATSSACGGAGTARLDGQDLPLRVDDPAPSATSATAKNSVVRAVACATASLRPGAHRLTITPPASGEIVAATLGRSPVPEGPGNTPREVRVRHTSASDRVAQLGAGDATTIALTEGDNAGWQARTSAGTQLKAVRVDGWRQGFVVPAGGPTTVTITFAPTRTHRIGLAAGALGALLLATVWLVTMRSRRSWTIQPVSVQSLSVPSTLGLAALVSVLIGGPIAILAVVPVVGVALLAPRRLGELACGAMGLAAVAMLALGVVDQRSAGSVVAQVLACVTVSAAVTGLASPDGRESESGTRSASRTPTPPSG